MRIAICVKEVLDPGAVNNYAIAGKLEIGDDGKSLTQTTIPRLINGFDEQRHYSNLWVVDANGDQRADVCGRADDGIYCAMGRSWAYGLFHPNDLSEPTIRWVKSNAVAGGATRRATVMMLPTASKHATHVAAVKIMTP